MHRAIQHEAALPCWAVRRRAEIRWRGRFVVGNDGGHGYGWPIRFCDEWRVDPSDYLWIPGPDLGLARIRDRVEEGGHDVPACDVRRRYGRTLINLFTLYRPLVDLLQVFDNSLQTPRLIFMDEAGKTVVYDDMLYEQMLREVNR